MCLNKSVEPKEFNLSDRDKKSDDMNKTRSN
jgi:hypothetical protein